MENGLTGLIRKAVLYPADVENRGIPMYSTRMRGQEYCVNGLFNHEKAVMLATVNKNDKTRC